MTPLGSLLLSPSHDPSCVLFSSSNMKLQAVAVLAVSQVWPVFGQTNATDKPSEVPYYGLSPAVYPARESSLPPIGSKSHPVNLHDTS